MEKMKLFTLSKRFGGVHIRDQHYENNGGHTEYKILKFEVGYKDKTTMLCVIEFDIYGKCETNQFTEKEFRVKFGVYTDEILAQLPNNQN